MGLSRQSIHGGWTSSWTFVAAATSSTIGLGSLWKFAYLAGANGGAGFVLVYLGSMIFIAAPVLLAELLLGSRGRADPIHTLRMMTMESATGRGWRVIGWLGCGAGLIVLSYFSVVGGWVLSYVQHLGGGSLAELGAREVGERFGRLLGDAPAQMALHGLFMVLTWVVVALGVKRGLGVAARWLLPLLLALLVAITAYALKYGDAAAAAEFMFASRPVDLRADGALTALGHAFFSLSVGMGAMMTYGAYAPDRRSYARMVGLVVLLNIAVALLAGFAIFPLVFAQHLQPSHGPGLMFVTLPFVFGHMPYGGLVGTAFFLLVAVAALGSTVALLEPTTAWLVQRFGWRRPVAAALLAMLAWAGGLLSIFSFAEWGDWRPGGKSVFAWLDWLSAQVMLPVGGILIALFVGWRMRSEGLKDELFADHPVFFLIWRGILRYIAAPALIGFLAAGSYQLWRSIGTGGV